METKSSKPFEGWGTNLWHKYRTDLFFRTTCHIIILQIILTVIIITGLWFVTGFLIRDTSHTLTSNFMDMLAGQNMSSDTVWTSLVDVQSAWFWPAMVIASAIILSFGFVMAYIALTPTRRSLERQKRFVSNIAHELRTSLSIIRTNTDVTLMHDELSDKVRSMLDRNTAELDRISEIMNNLLSLSNFMRGGNLQLEDVTLTPVAERALDALNGVGYPKDITISLKANTSKTVIGNASALEQVVFNLVKNAIAHTNSGGIITVVIEDAGDGKYINLSVSDTGSGIARSDLFHIFEPFYRSRKVKKDGGQGLGLSIVNEIVQIHRGKIRVRSAEGYGTTVTVSLKRSVGDMEHPESEQAKTTEEIVLDFSHRILE